MTFGAAYDAWLTTDPREVSAAEEDAFEAFCEENDLTGNDADWEAFREEMEAREEDYAVQYAEDRMEQERLDRDDFDRY